jgi:hypothetical protein
MGNYKYVATAFEKRHKNKKAYPGLIALIALPSEPLFIMILIVMPPPMPPVDHRKINIREIPLQKVHFGANDCSSEFISLCYERCND